MTPASRFEYTRLHQRRRWLCAGSAVSIICAMRKLRENQRHPSPATAPYRSHMRPRLPVVHSPIVPSTFPSSLRLLDKIHHPLPTLIRSFHADMQDQISCQDRRTSLNPPLSKSSCSLRMRPPGLAATSQTLVRYSRIPSRLVR